LAVVPSKSKHAVLLQVLSHQFDFSNSFLSEMQRFFDVRSAALSLSLSYIQKTAGPKAFLMSRLSLLEYS